MPAQKKNKGGRPPEKLTIKFRQFCREVISDEEVLANLLATAKKDAAFCLKLAEFGIGRPFQAIHVKAEHSGEVRQTVREIQLHDGSAALPTVTAVPDLGPN